MRLDWLELHDFRSYPHARVEFQPGAQVFVGPNAQGKTNLLEAVHYLALGTSHRVASDGPLVRQGAPQAVVRAGMTSTADPAGGTHALTVELELRPGGANRARLNGQARRVRDVIGTMRAVLFAPEDLHLVRGDPADRRRFLDDLLAQRRPAYRVARQDYERIVRQRNSLLKRLRAGGRAPWAPATDLSAPDDAGGDLEVWTDALVHAGATLLAARIAAVHALAAPVADAYRDLVAASPEREAAGAVTLAYELSTGRRITGRPGEGVPDPALLADELRAGVVERERAERERAMTLVGPHRDDLALELHGLPAKGYASHGELWSLALALRLASRELLVAVGEEPVVLLDDVFAELDEHRRSRLAERCREFEQVLVTAAVDDDVPLAGPRHLVRAGVVTGVAP